MSRSPLRPWASLTHQPASSYPISVEGYPRIQGRLERRVFYFKDVRCSCNVSTPYCFMIVCRPLTALTEWSYPSFVSILIFRLPRDQQVPRVKKIIIIIIFRSKIASRTARAFSRSRCRSYSVMRTFDEKRGVWRMRKPQDILARYESVVIYLAMFVESIVLAIWLISFVTNSMFSSFYYIVINTVLSVFYLDNWSLIPLWVVDDGRGHMT